MRFAVVLAVILVTLAQCISAVNLDVQTSLEVLDPYTGQAVYQHTLTFDKSCFPQFITNDEFCIQPSSISRVLEITANFLVKVDSLDAPSVFESIKLNKKDENSFCGTFTNSHVLDKEVVVKFDVSATTVIPQGSQYMATTLDRASTRISSYSATYFYKDRDFLFYTFLDSNPGQGITYFSTFVPEAPYKSNALRFHNDPKFGFVLETELNTGTAMFCTHYPEKGFTECPLTQFCVGADFPFVCRLDLFLNIYKVNAIRAVPVQLAVESIYMQDGSSTSRQIGDIRVVEKRELILPFLSLTESYNFTSGDQINISFGTQGFVPHDVIVLDVLPGCDYITLGKINSLYPEVFCAASGDKQIKCTSNLKEVYYYLPISGLTFNPSGSCAITITQTNSDTNFMKYTNTVYAGRAHYFANSVGYSKLAPVSTKHSAVEPLAFDFRVAITSSVDKTTFARVRYPTAHFSVAERFIEYQGKQEPCVDGKALNILPYPYEGFVEFFCPISSYGIYNIDGNFTGSIRGLVFNTGIITDSLNKFSVEATVIRVPSDATPQVPVASEAVILVSTKETIPLENAYKVIDLSSASLRFGNMGYSVENPVQLTLTAFDSVNIIHGRRIIIDFSEPVFPVANVRVACSSPVTEIGCVAESSTRLHVKFSNDKPFSVSELTVKFDTAHLAVKQGVTATVRVTQDGITSDFLAFYGQTANII